jgi:hypothetical protein
MYILAALGVGLVIYAIFGVFTSGKSGAPKKKKIQNQSLSAEDSGGEQKIQRLQSQIVRLESQLEEARVTPAEKKSGSVIDKEKEAEFSVELKRREEWVAKAEAELTKVKAENSDLNNKFITKEKELQEEFTKNVNLTRQMREMKTALEAKEMACRLKEDQLQAQKHQSESQLKSIDGYLATIAEFKRKEKISEWVPKLEFNQLNDEYTKLEKDLEASQERLKSFAAEIAQLRQLADKKSLPAEEIKAPEVLPKENPPEKSTSEEIKLKETVLEEIKQEGVGVEENKSREESQAAEEIKAPEIVLEEIKPEEIKNAEENLENKNQESEE